MIPVVLSVLIFNFVLIHVAPGDPAVMLAGEGGTQQYIEATRIRYGLNLPLYQQLGIYLNNVFHGDLGYSFSDHRAVLPLILQRIPATLLLVLTSEVFAIVLGTLIGAFSAKKYGTKTDGLIAFLSIIMFSLPVFWFGIMMILLFGIEWHMFPIMGMTSVGEGLTGLAYYQDLLWHLFLPSFTLSICYLVPMYLRLTRSSMIEVMNEDFITAARAKGLSENTVFFKHALRNALLPTVTQAGLELGFVLGGMLMTETVFSWPGLGRYMFVSVFRRDYPVLMGLFLIIAITVVVASLLTDIVYARLDPRVVYQ